MTTTSGRRFSTAFILLVAVLGAVTVSRAQVPAYRVQRVVDGDTVVLSTIGTVRLIGVDTPETVDPREPVQRFGQESAAFLRSMLEGQPVRLEYDRQRLDKYQRTLAYLYLSDGTFVNLEIVRQGYGHAYVDYPFAHMEAFRSVEREAREARRGLWGDTPPVSAQGLASAEPARVWVNTSSRVYHCPGARYYGNTARGQYMTEADAQQNGYRAAYGRSCAPASTAVSSPTADRAESPRAVAAPPLRIESSTKVWVNTSSKVYHCPGTRYYGNTARGAYMSEAEAQQKGFRAAYGRSCS